MACATEKDLVAAAAVNAARTQRAASSSAPRCSTTPTTRAASRTTTIEVLTTTRPRATPRSTGTRPPRRRTQLIDDRTVFNMLSRSKRMAIRPAEPRSALKKTIETTGRRLAEIDGPVAAKPAEDFNRVVTFPGLKAGSRCCKVSCFFRVVTPRLAITRRTRSGTHGGARLAAVRSARAERGERGAPSGALPAAM